MKDNHRRLITANGLPRGYIQPYALEELSFHTGTACNLSCPFCLEGSRPGDDRLDRVKLDDLRPFLDEAVELGVKQFSFTGGEPFIVRDFVNILKYASNRLPCLVLTNGTDVVLKRLHHIARLKNPRNPISFRISIDFPDQKKHDAGRGKGNYQKALLGMKSLHDMGFHVSLARQMEPDEDSNATDNSFREIMVAAGIPRDTRIVAFPDFGTPGTNTKVPDISEDCMTRYHDNASRQQFMCAFSKMVIKQNGQMRVYACTLVDDNPDYDLGNSLTAALSSRIMLHHHRCYSCFSLGSSCSER